MIGFMCLGLRFLCLIPGIMLIDPLLKWYPQVILSYSVFTVARDFVMLPSADSATATWSA
jgi:hypothetical protein